MKKVCSLLLCAVLAVTLSACSPKPSASRTPAPTATPSPTPDITTPSPAPEETEEPAAAVCYLPVTITAYYDIPEAAADQLGHGSYQETVASYQYDGAGRLTRYAAGDGTMVLSVQYLDEIALPAALELGSGTTITFTQPRWAQDGPDIVLDVTFDGEDLPADFRLSSLRQDADGKLVGADIFWNSQFGQEAYPVAGHSFDEGGNLVFEPLVLEGYTEEYRYQYGDEGQAVGLEHWQDGVLAETVQVDPAGRPVSVESVLGGSGAYQDMGDGRYRSDGGGDWTELAFDENGNFYQYILYNETSGITYTYTVEYMTMPLEQYAGTPVDYTNVCPILCSAAQNPLFSYAGAVGNLQLPVSAQPFWGLWS